MHLHKTSIHVLTDIYDIQKCPKNSRSAKFAKRRSLGCHSNCVNQGMTVKRKRRTYQVYGFMTEQLFFKIRYIKFFLHHTPFYYIQLTHMLKLACIVIVIKALQQCHKKFWKKVQQVSTRYSGGGRYRGFYNATFQQHRAA